MPDSQMNFWEETLGRSLPPKQIFGGKLKEQNRINDKKLRRGPEFFEDVMISKKEKIHIGTSGWVYRHWRGVFYPEDLPDKKKLKFFSEHFKTAEVNYSFYRLPALKVFENWREQTPDDFIFAVKASRFITHVKRLRDVGGAWTEFLRRAKGLKEKTGPLLLQFSPNFKFNDANLRRIETFLEESKSIEKKLFGKKLKLAFEFRDASWVNEKIFEVLKKHQAAWVIADSGAYPKTEAVTARFVYVRMHGPAGLFGSGYPENEIKSLAERIKTWTKNNLEVYVYFNNDAQGFAVKNAKELLSFLKRL